MIKATRCGRKGWMMHMENLINPVIFYDNENQNALLNYYLESEFYENNRQLEELFEVYSNISNKSKSIEIANRVEGKTFTSPYGDKYKILKYGNSLNVLVEFENGYICNAPMGELIRGFYTPFQRTVYGIGYIGLGKYKASENHKATKEYRTWSSMFERCYSEKHLSYRPRYAGCFVNEHWHNFQNFGMWFEKTYYEIPGERVCLDKDILYKGNKEYSMWTCCFVPEIINTCFTKRTKDRGDCPIGTKRHKDKYEAKVSEYGRDIYLGLYDRPIDAFVAYKYEKEKYIKELAEMYKQYLQPNVYYALMHYEVDFND